MTLSLALGALRSGALLIEKPRWGTLAVSGPEAQPWLNGLLTCDVKSLAPGLGAWALALTKQGKIQSDLNLVSTDTGIYASTAPGTTAALFAAFQRFLIMEDAELLNRSDDYAWLTLHGPLSTAVATALAPLHAACAASIDWTGLGGAAIVVPRTALDKLVAALTEHEGVVLGSPEVWERVRIEHLVPEYGRDFGPQDNPHEASLESRAVSFTKGCYLGQEAVCMQDMRGKVKRRIVSVKLSGAEQLDAGTAVLADAEPVGEITSSCPAPDLGGSVALARLSSKVLEGRLSLNALNAGGHPLSILKQPQAHT